MNLKSETPLIKKLEIKRLEDECENLRLWRWRLTIAIELILITVLGACVVNFYAMAVNNSLAKKPAKMGLTAYLSLWIGEDGGMNAMPLSDILDRPENHFLVDVPAVVNPDFEQAVQEMTGTDQVDPEEIIQDIFEMVFLDGMTQREAAECVGYTQARISQILKDL